MRAPMPLRLDFVPMVRILIQLFLLAESQRMSCGGALTQLTAKSRSPSLSKSPKAQPRAGAGAEIPAPALREMSSRSEEHTSELQSPCNLVCRLLLEKKKKKRRTTLPPVTR